jgi:hypothetical protein
MQGKKALKGSSQGGGGLAVSDVFSTYVYEGSGATQDIVNGIDLATEGGMVWIKDRSATSSNYLYDTERGTGYALLSESTNSEAYSATRLTSFNSDGFNPGSNSGTNTNGSDFASWTFRKSPKFFDVVKYTGNGVAGREIPHELGCDVGMMVVKRLDTAFSWIVYHNQTGNSSYLLLDSTNAQVTGTPAWNNTTPTSSIFTLGSLAGVNANGGDYIAYIFAHNETDGLVEGDGKPIIKCGSYVGSASPVEIDLGFEPQYVMIKSTVQAGNWYVADNIRSMTADAYTDFLYPNSSASEGGLSNGVITTPTGFIVDAGGGYAINHSTSSYIYMAIRRNMSNECN